VRVVSERDEGRRRAVDPAMAAGPESAGDVVQAVAAFVDDLVEDAPASSGDGDIGPGPEDPSTADDDA